MGPTRATAFDDLSSRSNARFERGLDAARSAGPVGAEAIVDRLEGASGYQRVMMIATLGDLRGGQGVSRALAEGIDRHSGWNTDQRDAAVLALAKREESGAEPVLRSALRSSPDYAMLSLARYGTRACRDDVLGHLTVVVRRTPPRWRESEGSWDRVVLGIVLLARLGSADWLTTELVPVLGGSGLSRLTDAERTALEGLSPEGVDAGHPEFWVRIAERAFSRLRSDPLFAPLE